jgi:hypothetical protein
MDESRIGRDRITMAHAMTPELRLMVAPAITYAVLARQSSPVGPITALRRPLLAAIVLGVSIAISGTGHVTPALVLRTTVAWSFVVVLQIAIALAVIAAPARRTVGVPRALDLFFASHAPWSIFFLIAVLLPPPVGGSTPALLALTVIPIGLTARAIAAYFREVLRLDRRRARRLTIVHQAITWTVFVVLFGSVVALRPRIVELLGW